MAFGESVGLLIITAALTGLLVPVVKNYIDEKTLDKQNKFQDARLKAEKEFDADLSRQTKVIDSQAQLLDELAATLWTIEKLLMKITYYGGRGDKGKFLEAFNAFDDQAWSLLAEFLSEISKARRLASDEAHNKLVALHTLFQENVPGRLGRLRPGPNEEGDAFLSAGLQAKCKELNGWTYENLARQIDEALAYLALEFRLAPA